MSAEEESEIYGHVRKIKCLENTTWRRNCKVRMLLRTSSEDVEHLQGVFHWFPPAATSARDLRLEFNIINTAVTGVA
jgi:hypothetical protein